MKKVLSVLLAGAMTASMAVSAFAADVTANKVYNDDGEDIVGNDKDVWGDVKAPFTTTDRNSITVDGVVPGITMYIPLAKNMSDKVTDGTTGSTPIDDAQIVAKLDKTDFKPVQKLEKDKTYLNDTLDGKVSVVLGSASEDEIADKLVDKYGAKEVDVATYTPDSGDLFLDKVAKNTVAGDDADLATKAYTKDSNYIKLVAASATTDIPAATDAVKVDKATAPKAFKNGSDYYLTSLSDDAIKTAVEAAKKAATTTPTAKYDISWDSLSDKDLFKFDVDKDDGSKYVKKIELVYDKKLSNLDQRTAFLKVTLNDSQTTSDLKSTGTVTFKAKKSNVDAKVTDETWADNKEVQIDYTFWINNVKKQNDASIDTGDRVYFDPDDNEDNTLVWGDDRAALFFEGNDDAGKFYARLQTKADSEIYATYGDPVNADLWFYDFVGNPTVPSTSRATLTLGIPWDEDDDYTPNPEDCFIYEMDADGYLTDVTNRFTYDEENDGSTEIDGWTIKTRTLGTYVISDTELDTTIVEEVEEVEEEEVNDDAAADTTDGGKEIPNTGSSDMVGIAVVAAVASLAAGAVAFKKASK